MAELCRGWSKAARNDGGATGCAEDDGEGGASNPSSRDDRASGGSWISIESEWWSWWGWGVFERGLRRWVGESGGDITRS